MARRVAVVGASRSPDKYGYRAVVAYQRAGWEVYPINPTVAEVAGLPAWPRLADLPTPVDRVSLYLPPAIGLTLLDDIAAAHPAEFYVNPGAESDELLARARALGLEPIEACSIIAVGQRPENI